MTNPLRHVDRLTHLLLKSGAINMTANVRSTKRRTLRQIVFVLGEKPTIRYMHHDVMQSFVVVFLLVSMLSFATCNKMTVNTITVPTLKEHQLLRLVSIVDPAWIDRPDILVEARLGRDLRQQSTLSGTRTDGPNYMHQQSLDCTKS